MSRVQPRDIGNDTIARRGGRTSNLVTDAFISGTEEMDAGQRCSLTRPGLSTVDVLSAALRRLSSQRLIGLSVRGSGNEMPKASRGMRYTGRCTPSQRRELPQRSWLRGPAVGRWSLADVLSLSCARLVADG